MNEPLMKRYEEMRQACLRFVNIHPDDPATCFYALKKSRHIPHVLVELAALCDDMALALRRPAAQEAEGDVVLKEIEYPEKFISMHGKRFLWVIARMFKAYVKGYADHAGPEKFRHSVNSEDYNNMALIEVENYLINYLNEHAGSRQNLRTAVKSDPLTAIRHEQGDKDYKANILWPFEDGTVEQAGYEFANAKTPEYQKEWWKELLARATTHTPLSIATQDDKLRRCTQCGFIIDTSYKAEFTEDKPC